MSNIGHIYETISWSWGSFRMGGGGGEGEVLRKAVGNLVVELLKCERTAHGKKWLRQIPALWMRKINGSDVGGLPLIFFFFFPSPHSTILSKEKQHNCHQLRKLQKWKLLCTGPVPGRVYDLRHQVIQLISKGNQSLLVKMWDLWINSNAKYKCYNSKKNGRSNQWLVEMVCGDHLHYSLIIFKQLSFNPPVLP